AAQGRRRLRSGRAECLDDDAIEVDQADESQRRGHLLGVVQLGRVAEVHREAVVDQEVDVQVFFLHEQAEEEAIKAGVKVPVEEAEVIADDVVAVIGELDRLALALAAPLALHAAEEDLARDQLELLEPGEKVWGEQRLALRVRHGGSYHTP